MGCDWHPYLEKRTESGWEPLWEPTLEAGCWYERILEENLDSGAGDLLAFSYDPDDAKSALEAYFKSLTHSEIMEKFERDHRVWWEWKEHDYSFRGRDYRWFGAIAGVRGHIQIFAPRGIPDDLSLRVKIAYEDQLCDSHTHSWLMVEEIFNRFPQDQHLFSQVEWLRERVERPDTTRLVFWFDN